MDDNITNFSEVLQDLYTDLIGFIPDLVISLIIFLAGLYLAGVIRRVQSRWLAGRGADTETTIVIEAITKWTLYVLVTTIALNQIGFNLTAFLTGLGILGFTVGFAIQDVSKNFVAGLLLLIEQPFGIGEQIEVNGFTGNVLDVQLRATEMRTLDGRIVQIPNADVFTSPITNFTRAAMRRIELKTGVAYGTDLEAARGAALQAIFHLEGVLIDPAPRLVYDKLGPSSVEFSLYYWIDTAATDYLAAVDGGVVAIETAFSAAGIEMPFPMQTVINR
ncbi:MAG TPA: mechanosensitive ion channel [Anaerolineales bacterium]|nr:mechanosensitive ion channel [Anaerolineales bacterium]